jgi:hypothetical protein
MAICMRPTIAVSKMARAMYCSVPACASAPMPAPTISMSMATGPMAICRELPKSGYVSSGTSPA